MRLFEKVKSIKTKRKVTYTRNEVIAHFENTLSFHYNLNCLVITKSPIQRVDNSIIFDFEVTDFYLNYRLTDSSLNFKIEPRSYFFKRPKTLEERYRIEDGKALLFNNHKFLEALNAFSHYHFEAECKDGMIRFHAYFSSQVTEKEWNQLLNLIEIIILRTRKIRSIRE